MPTNVRNLPRYPVSKLLILDHDRTRSPVSAAVDRLARIVSAAPYNVSTSQLRTVQAVTEADGMSFDPLTYVRQTLLERGDDQLFDEFKAAFVAGEPEELLYPDVPLFETALRGQPPVPHLVMTAGVNVEWQALKVAASGFTGYTHIMEVGPSLKTPPHAVRKLNPTVSA